MKGQRIMEELGGMSSLERRKFRVDGRRSGYATGQQVTRAQSEFSCRFIAMDR